MKKKLLKLSTLIGKKGDTVILTVMVLLILFIFTTSMLVLFSLWFKSTSKILSGKKAHKFAKTGIEEAIWEIDNDGIEVDSFFDSWRVNFKGEDIDLNGDGNPDSRWLYIKNKEGEKVGRYAVLVEDENSKININYSGNLERNETTYTVQDIKLLPKLLGQKNSNNIVIHRQQREFLTPSEIKMVKGVSEVTYEKIKNFITCFSYDLNHNKEDKLRIDINTASYEELYNLFKSIDYTEEAARQIVLNIISYREKNRPLPCKTFGKEDVIGIGKTPYLNEIDAVKPWDKKVLESGVIIFSEHGGQFIELFNPYEKELDISGWKITGVVTLFSNQWKDIFNFSSNTFNDINQGETDIDPEKIKGLWEKLSPTSINIPKGRKIPPRSYYTIGDRIELKILIIPSKPPLIVPLPIPIRDPENCNQYEPILAINPGSLGFISDLLQYIPFLANLGLDFRMRLFDSKGNIVENTTYFVDLPYSTVQKNDPRKSSSSDWSLGEETAGRQNINFQPWLGDEFSQSNWTLNWPSHFIIKNDKFRSLGELSFIHKNQQWQTLDFWKYATDRKLIDHLTIVEKPKKPTFGRLNINTSSETVLLCLPNVDKNLTKKIIEARPYKDISDILGTFGSEETSMEKLNKEITKYGFDNKDNDKDTYIDIDKEKEMIFDKIINLITVRSNVFKIISLGQEVQNIQKDDTIVEKIISEKKVVVWYDRRKKKIIHRKEIE